MEVSAGPGDLSQRSNGEGFASKLTHLIVGNIQFLHGFGQEPSSVPHHVGHRAAYNVAGGYTTASK